MCHSAFSTPSPFQSCCSQPFSTVLLDSREHWWLICTNSPTFPEVTWSIDLQNLRELQESASYDGKKSSPPTFTAPNVVLTDQQEGHGARKSLLDEVKCTLVCDTPLKKRAIVTESSMTPQRAKPAEARCWQYLYLLSFLTLRALQCQKYWSTANITGQGRQA